MQRENLVDLGSRLVEATEMPESRGRNPTGDICVRRDCHRTPSPTDTFLEGVSAKREAPSSDS